MRNKIVYEWCYETVDEHGDIIDHHFEDKLISFMNSDKTDTLVLVRDEGNEIEGLVNRTWAYVKDDMIPKYFRNDYDIEDCKVPKRFHVELQKHLSSHG